MARIYLVAVLGLLISTASCKPTSNDPPDYAEYGLQNDNDGNVEDDLQNDNEGDVNYNYDDDEKGADNTASSTDDSKVVVMLTPGQEFAGYDNDNFILPCKANGTDIVFIWHKDNEFYFQDNVVINAPSNIKRLPDGSLNITNFSKKDAGNYECKAMTDTKPAIVHHVVYKPSAPQIDVLMAKDNLTVLGAGETLSMTCLASGRPKPTVSWHKGDERLATEGENLTITNIKHRDAGLYRCLADNGVAKPAHARIEIKVEFKPIVSIEKIVINSDTNFDTELKCVVHAEPRASVVWKKNGLNVVSTENVVLRNEGHNHILLIKGLRESDFGQYTCSAVNSLGETSKQMSLVKTPVISRFVKPENEAKDVVLTWEMQSRSPIAQHELHYRKQGMDKWKIMHPKVVDSENDLYTVKATLTGLEPGVYEAKIRSRNEHGWSEYSETVPFEGVYSKHGHHHHKKGHKDSKDTEKHNTPETGKKVKQSEVEMGPPSEQLDDTRVGAASKTSSSPPSSVASMASLFSIALLVLVCNRQ